MEVKQRLLTSNWSSYREQQGDGGSHGSHECYTWKLKRNRWQSMSAPSKNMSNTLKNKIEKSQGKSKHSECPF